MKFLVICLVTGVVSGCGALNKDNADNLSKDPKVCVDGIKYLPYTNGKDEAFTSEGKVETCQAKPSKK